MSSLSANSYKKTNCSKHFLIIPPTFEDAKITTRKLPPEVCLLQNRFINKIKESKVFLYLLLSTPFFTPI